MRPLVECAIATMPGHAKADWMPIVEFVLDRARTYFSEQGYATTAIEAVMQPFGATSPLFVLLETVAEASTFIATEEGRILADANKRIANILRKSGFDVPFGISPEQLKVRPDAKLFRERAEEELWQALQRIGIESLHLKQQQRFAESLRILSRLGVPIKAFFDDVMVNTDKENIRNNRITLLQHAHAYMNQVADLSLMAA
jgi:glycyl-tRNA synthetase beta chain